MKKILCTALAVCILLGGVLALPAFAETPAAIPADHEPRVLNELSGNAAFMRNLKAMLTKTATPFRVKSAKTKSPADAVGAAPAEGAVATLQLCTSFHPSEAPVNVDGHAFFIVTNVSDADLDVGGLLIAPGTAMTIGSRANRDEHGGLWYNLEGFYNYYIDDYYPDVHSMQVSLSQEQLDAFNAALPNCDKWSGVYNCVAFTTAIWNAVCADRLCPVLPTPEELTHSMSGYEGKVTEHPEIPYDYVVYYGYPATRSQDYQ